VNIRVGLNGGRSSTVCTSPLEALPMMDEQGFLPLVLISAERGKLEA